MAAETFEEKQAQFDEFFKIQHKLNVNVTLLDDDAVLPDLEQLEEAMPYAFRMATELATIEAKALRPLRHLGDHAIELAEYLTHQSRKIDLMMSFILQQQDLESQRFRSTEIGGGGLVIQDDEPMEIGALAELKIFITEEASAIFCYGEVIACEQQEDGDYHIAFVYSRIREQDQELIVRATLHLQTQQLKKRAKNKQA